MKSISLMYPDKWVIDHVQKMLDFKKFEVLSIDSEKGVIKAIRKRKFRNDSLVNLKVSTVDSIITTLHLSVSSDGKPGYFPVNTANEEEQLVNTIQDLL